MTCDHLRPPRDSTSDMHLLIVVGGLFLQGPDSTRHRALGQVGEDDGTS